MKKDIIHSFTHSSSLNTYTSRPIRLYNKRQHDNKSAHHIHIFHAKKEEKNKGCENSPHNPILPTSVEFYPMVPNLKSQKVRPLTITITTTTTTITVIIIIIIYYSPGQVY